MKLTLWTDTLNVIKSKHVANALVNKSPRMYKYQMPLELCVGI